MQNKANCVLCKIAKHEVDAAIVCENDHIIAILDRFPATRGHVLILPKEHIENIYEMPVETGMEIMRIAISVCNGIKLILRPDGLNLIQANGEAGGQTIDHFHLHIVPRYNNDSVILKFGHGSVPADRNELINTAAAVRRAL